MASNDFNSPAAALLQVLVASADKLRFESRLNPPELCQVMSRSEGMAAELGIPGKPPTSLGQNAGAASLIIDCHSILLDQLVEGEDGPDIEAQVAAEQRRAAIALTWLPPAMRSDLNLFLVAPAGSAGSSTWSDIAARVERNEQVCRKLVWLPSAEKSTWEEQAARFCDRTFLARPWFGQTRFETEPRLDPLGRLMEQDPVMARWLSIVDIDEGGDYDLIDALVDAWKTNAVEPRRVSP
jgi:hypothetical protein